VIGRREGRNPDAPVVLAGSHVDSVRSGDFDGPLCVLAAIEAAQTMREVGVETGRPVKVIAFTDEEGARFGLGMIGSRALAGLLTPDDLSREDENGVMIAEAMREVGLDPERIGEAARGPGSVHAYVELHIEQGRVLEQRGLPVGVVTGIAGPVWLRFVLRGEAGHAGATPMGSSRRDALAAATAVVGAVEREAERSGTSVGTVGRMEVEPGGVNVIPGRATFTVDQRDIDGDVRDRLEARNADEAARVCEQRGVGRETETLQRLPPVPCSGEARDAIVAACERLGFDPFGLPSGAGHDGMQLSGLCPIGMIFVRSRDGIGHNPAE
jgi:allantoate deiminase